MNGDDEPDGDEQLESPHEPDEVDERAESFFEALGIPDRMYATAFEVAIRHALAPRPAPVVADRPWVPIGPRNIGGRILALAQDPTNRLIIYAGSAQGGLWRTIDGGDAWEHLGDAEHNFPVGAIAIPRQSPKTLYVGTGSLHPRHGSGRGLYKVTVPGPRAPALFERLAGVDPPTQAPAAATPGRAPRYTAIRVDPDDPTRFWAASQTGLWRCQVPLAPVPATPASIRFTFEFPPAANAPAGTPALSPGPVPPLGFGWPPYATDVLVARDPRQDEVVGDRARYLVIYVGIDGGGVFRGRYDRTTDTTTWEKQLAVPNPPLTFTRVRLALCQNNPRHVYAVMARPSRQATPVYYSEDNGETWTARATLPAAANGQADFDLVLEVNPNNPKVVMCGAVDLCKSENAALSWTPVSNWRLYDVGDHGQHADFHALIFDVADRTTVWVGNDGGLSVARDLRAIGSPGPMKFWRKRSHGILAGQFQDVSAHPTLPFMSGGGLQDNGSWVGLGGPTWYRISGGDGGEVAFRTGTPRQFFPTVQRRARVTTVVAAAHSPFVLQAGRFIVSAAARDVPAPAGAVQDAFEVRRDNFPRPASGPFIMAAAEDPLVPGQLLVTGASTPAQSIAYRLPPPPLPPLGAAPAALPVALGFNAVNGPGGVALGPPALPAGLEATAVAFGPVIPGLAPPAVDAWFGTSDGRLFVSTNGSAGNFAPPAGAPAWPPGVPMRVTRIAVHPSDPRIVVVTGVPNVRPVAIRITTGGAVGGAARFVFSQGSGVSAPLPVVGAVPIPVAPVTVNFAGPGGFIAGDRWTIDPDGTVTAQGNAGGGPNTSAGTVTASTPLGLPITVTITTAGPRGDVGVAAPAQFSYRVGAAAVVGPQATAARFPVPATLITLNFGLGAYVAADSWTVAPNGVVTPAGGNTSAGVLSAEAWQGGRALGTYDRGATWVDITERTAPLPRPDPDLDSLPPCVITSLAFDPGGPTSLFAGTLAGVYVLRNLPSPTAIAVAPTPLAIPAGQSRQLTANVTLTGVGAPQNWTTQVDWSSSAPARATVNALGQVTGVAAGPVTITVRRGTLTAVAAVTVTAPAGAGPALPAPPVAAPPPIAVAWRPFAQRLPLMLVNDLATVPGTRLLRAASYGRGIWECDLGPLPPRFQLYIRHTVIEEGRTYPRAIPALVPDDPRLPAGAVGLDFTHAFDIRVDAPPFSFFEDRVDGVEFDEQLGADTLVALQRNLIYVQVHNSGWDAVAGVTVHLYFMASAPAPVLGPPGSPVPAGLGPVGDFYGAAGPTDPAPAAAWQRVGPAQSLARVAPGEPATARFDWVVPDALGPNIALLALCTAASDGAWPAAPANVAALVTSERRAALRIVPVAARAPVSIFIRDGITDDGVRTGSTRFGGRSPDIIVVQAEPAAAPDVAFRDLLDPRPQDRIRAGMPNHIYVRVHNRGPVDTTVEIEIWAVPVGADNQPSFAPGTWTRLSPTPPGPPPPLTVNVPPGRSAIAHQVWPAADVTDPNPADAYKAYLILALIRTTDNVDPLPDTARIDALPAFWEFFLRMTDSENAASRALRFEP